MTSPDVVVSLGECVAEQLAVGIVSRFNDAAVQVDQCGDLFKALQGGTLSRFGR